MPDTYVRVSHSQVQTSKGCSAWGQSAEREREEVGSWGPSVVTRMGDEDLGRQPLCREKNMPLGW
jgi:hypothetical protein